MGVGRRATDPQTRRTMYLTDTGGLFKALADLNLPRGDYVVCGSAALYVRGLRARMGDLDILARGTAWRIACTLALPTPSPIGRGCVITHPTASIEIMSEWQLGPSHLAWDTDTLIERADVIDGMPIMRLGDVLAWKETHRRPKDLPDIAAIHDLHRMWQGKAAALY